MITALTSNRDNVFKGGFYTVKKGFGATDPLAFLISGPGELLPRRGGI